MDELACGKPGVSQYVRVVAEGIGFDHLVLRVNHPIMGYTHAFVYIAFPDAILGSGPPRENFDDQIRRAVDACLLHNPAVLAGYVYQVGLDYVRVGQCHINRRIEHLAVRVAQGEVVFQNTLKAPGYSLVMDVRRRFPNQHAIEDFVAETLLIGQLEIVFIRVHLVRHVLGLGFAHRIGRLAGGRFPITIAHVDSLRLMSLEFASRVAWDLEGRFMLFWAASTTRRGRM